MKRFFMLLAIVLASVPLCAANAKGKNVETSQTISFKISANTFTIVPKAGWKLQEQQSIPEQFEVVLIHGPKDVFSLQLNFICDTSDPAKLDTPEKMKEFLKESTVKFYMDSLEKEKKEGIYCRDFTAAGRFGYVTRFTDKKYQGDTPVPPEEWRYLTVGAFRLSNNSMMVFTLLTNTIDDKDYVELLEYIGSFTFSEEGEKGWKVADAREAYKIAATEFAKKYPEDSLQRQMPYSVRRDGTKWIVTGNMWHLTPGGCAYAEIDGPTGKILKLTHYK